MQIRTDAYPAAAPLPPTPGQTIGPFFGYATAHEQVYLPFRGGEHLVPPAHPRAMRLTGTVYDGNGSPVPDAMLEIWQADELGEIPQRSGSLVRDGWTFTGWGRVAVDNEGTYSFSTVRPGATEPGRAAFIHLVIFARGLPNKLHTRIYLPEDEEALAADPLLCSVDASRRSTLIGQREEDGALRFDIWLQGMGENSHRETVFLQFPGTDYPENHRGTA